MNESNSVLTNKSRRWILYTIATILTYPIIAHHLMYEFDLFHDEITHGPLGIFVQIFLSGPVLLILGFILLWQRKTIYELFIGILFLVVSAYWIFRIMQELANKS